MWIYAIDFDFFIQLIYFMKIVRMTSYLQLSLSVTVLLALTVFLLLVAETLPTQSDSVPLIGRYIPDGICGCCLSKDFRKFIDNYTLWPRWHFQANIGLLHLWS